MHVWPSGALVWRECSLRRVMLRLIVATLVFFAVLLLLTRAYVGYQSHRATTMLAEVGRVQVGDTEASVLPLVQRYGGHKWVPEGPVGPRENWTDMWAYEHRLRTMSDYAYDFDISPWGFPNGEGVLWGQRRRLDEMLWTAMNAIPVGLSPIFGMRDWNTGVQISIRGGRVSEVYAMVLVENREGWAGHQWRLAKEMPRENLQSHSYAIGATFLHITPGTGGGGVLNYLTPEASEEQVRAAHSFNAGCMTSVKDCNGYCELSPDAMHYLSQHLDAADNIIPPKCP